MKHLNNIILKTVALVGLLVFAGGMKGYAQETDTPPYGTNYSNTIFWDLSKGDVILLPDKSIGWTWNTSSQTWEFTTAGNNSSACVQYILMDPGNRFNGNPSSLSDYRHPVTKSSGGAVLIENRTDVAQVLLDWNQEGNNQHRPKSQKQIIVSCNVHYRVVLDNIWSEYQIADPYRITGGISFYPQSDGAKFDVYLIGDNRFGNIFYSSDWMDITHIYTDDPFNPGQKLDVGYHKDPPSDTFFSEAKLFLCSAEGKKKTSGTLTVGNIVPGRSYATEYGHDCTYNYYNSVIGGTDNRGENARGITINGGTIFAGAELGDVCTAIGGGGNGYGTVTIGGGIVTAVTSSTGTAIGGGIGWTQRGGQADVVITSGKVYAYNLGIVREYGDRNDRFVPATAIGGGSSFELPCESANVSISGDAVVFAQSIGGVAIGGGGSANMNGGNTTIEISGNAQVTAESLTGTIEGITVPYGSSIGGGVGGEGKGDTIANGGNCTFSMTGGTLRAGSVGGGSTNDSRGNIGFAKASISGSTTDIRAQFIMAAGGSEPCTFTMTGGTIHNNDINSTEYNLVKKDGGALWMDDPNGTVSISGNSVIENCKANSGGAVYTTGGAVDVSSATIQGCKALSGDGGAIAVMSAGASVTLTDATILNNTASGNGGAFFLKDDATVTINGGEIDDNTATMDGGAFFGSPRSSITMHSGSIQGNNARNGGGVFLDEDAQLTYTISEGNSYIRRNHASQYGGGAYLYKGTTNTKTRLTFIQNSNSLGFYDNTADVGADDIFAYGRQLTRFTIPDVTSMNLEGYSLPGATLQWWEDYAENDNRYDDGTTQKGDGADIKRYRESRDKLELIWKVPTSILPSSYEKYLCLTLGFEYGNLEIRRSGLHERENAVFKIEFQGELSRPAQYVTILGEESKKIEYDGVKYNVARIGFLPLGTYKVTEVPWAWYNESSSTEATVKIQDITDEEEKIFIFQNTHKDLGTTPLHDEELKVNDLKP